jgi:hypothetical protein
MPRPRVYENAHARNAACRKRRAEREGWAKKPVAEARMPCQESEAVKLYRATRAERWPEIKKREAKIMAKVKQAVADADARAYELRHRGRPKSAKRLPPLSLRSTPDALLASVPQWQGER